MLWPQGEDRMQTRNGRSGQDGREYDAPPDARRTRSGGLRSERRAMLRRLAGEGAVGSVVAG